MDSGKSIHEAQAGSSRQVSRGLLSLLLLMINTVIVNA